MGESLPVEGTASTKVLRPALPVWLEWGEGRYVLASAGMKAVRARSGDALALLLR